MDVLYYYFESKQTHRYGFSELNSNFSLNILNAEKWVGGHVTNSITSSFFSIIKFH